MCFLITNWLLPLVWTIVFIQFGNCSVQDSKQSPTPHTFRFVNPQQCLKNEFYNLNYFDCASCNEAGNEAGGINELQPTADRFSCQCPVGHVSIFEKTKRWPNCEEICSNATHQAENCTTPWPAQLPSWECHYQYLNATTATQQGVGIVLTRTNPGSNSSDCHVCDGTYNFRYQDYCIANTLMRAYLHYNAFWQATSSPKPNSNSRLHFGDLKFVAFFCLAMRNETACQQLANLCVLSHYSMDKHSPCSAFLLTQMSDVVMKYAHPGDQSRSLEPFLFYKKGRSTRELLTTTLQPSSQMELQIFSTNYDLSGRLKRWGSFDLQQLNLCPGQVAHKLHLAQRQQQINCQLSLEQLIDAATKEANDNYLSLYFNFSSNWQHLLHQLPVLIETLTPENKRPQSEEWQLVKRFQLISAHPKDNRQHQTLPRYEDAHKLQLYRSLRYVEHVQLEYSIQPGHTIGLPLLRLRYRHIELTGNATLTQLYPFRLVVKFERLHPGVAAQLLLELALPLLLLLASIAALLRLQNLRRRRGAELCQTSNLLELLLQLSANVALALLVTALLLLALQAFNPRQLAALIYPGCLLQLLYLGVHLRRASQLDLFLIDWERPRSSCEAQRLNLDSSSLCSSVRTYVAESSVSAWRVLFTANAWIRLSAAQRYSSLLQAFVVYAAHQLLQHFSKSTLDAGVSCCLIASIYVATYLLQLLLGRIFQANLLQKFIDLCSLANISLFSLLEPGYGYYIHGRSPHGFADTDMSSMILQLQREAQNMCGRRGLLMDSDKQAYIILPPRNLRNYLERLLLPLQRSRNGSMSQTLLYQKELQVPSIDGQVERTSIAYASVNRFFCAFIDHAIKDMDYIIKEKTIVEKLFNCEIENYLTDNKGTFYIDDSLSFSRVLLLGNHLHIFVLEILVLLSAYLLTSSLLIAVALACGLNMLLRHIFRLWVRRNVSRKTLIDERFLL
ncbi:meckelin [Drosophila sulfurigaster albostrigata]|uniref:meckelin n=1 Tax=Drosophila sulfurigaster albostrigata TaxID=89887 RepID=UPI002D21A166|nr:meckelin [Drosophila sulfurigaster albostrigata]